MTLPIILFAAFLTTVFLVALLGFFYLRKAKKKAAVIPITQFMTEASVSEVAVLEDIPDGGAVLFWHPFTATLSNLEQLQFAEEKVISERNGIHYINKGAFIIDKNTESKLDNDFAKLVESVV